jgi:hypothetical protein
MYSCLIKTSPLFCFPAFIISFLFYTSHSLLSSIFLFFLSVLYVSVIVLHPYFFPSLILSYILPLHILNLLRPHIRYSNVITDSLLNLILGCFTINYPHIKPGHLHRFLQIPPPSIRPPTSPREKQNTAFVSTLRLHHVVFTKQQLLQSFNLHTR